jgi:hypothetical protein
MKPSAAKLTELPLAPVFPPTPHKLRPNPPLDATASKPAKRDNIFSKSRDLREDRSLRQMKTAARPPNSARGR